MRQSEDSRRYRHGMTLIEILIAGGLFVLVLVLVGQLTVAAYTSNTRTTSKNQALRDGTIAVDRLDRELSMCSRVLLPTPLVPETVYHGGGQGAVPLVFRTYTSKASPSEQVVAYRFDANQKILERLVYDPGFDPGVPASQVLEEPARELAQWVEDFRFRQAAPALTSGAPFIRVELDLSSRDKSSLGIRTISTGTRVKSL